MSKETGKAMSDQEKLLQEKARKALKKNKTPIYSLEDEGGIMAGPVKSEDLEKDLDNE
ncbi:hypothetical protein [Endozoicomonas numazuensis]|uniref:hypothetical protein n=1 Tax=Endozoicomonas numazuensis TaxID=1137799 RepID=UPI000AD6FF3D|nr:hypothetical protein [Endozoicomonas numazuensis]